MEDLRVNIPEDEAVNQSSWEALRSVKQNEEAKLLNQDQLTGWLTFLFYFIFLFFYTNQTFS